MTTPREDVDEPVVLVTVFGPFPGQPSNPTGAIADALAGAEHVVSHVLDVSYDRATATIDDLVAMVDPAAVVCFGVAADATGIRLEEVARNRGGAQTPDVDGSHGPEGALDDGPPELPSRLPLHELRGALAAAGIDVEPSDDAGRYVCNHVFRHVVTHPRLQGRPAGFVHVPDPERSDMDHESIIVAGQIIAEVVAATARGEV